MDGLEILPIRGMGDVTPGDDLAEMITNAAPWLRDGDVLVVTSKIVSKAEGRLVDVPADGPERETARAEVLASETARVVARRGSTAIVQTHQGYVMAAAGIDASNVDKTHLVLLPLDSDASARALRSALGARGLHVAVIVSDTMGRAWRNGLTDVALGSAGIEPLRDHRGEIDPYGNELQLTEMAVIDELAGAGELVKGKCDQVPVAVVRGYPGAGQGDFRGATALLRDPASDMFSLGTAEARAAGLRDAATLPEASGPEARAAGATPPEASDAEARVVGATPPEASDAEARAAGATPPEASRAEALRPADTAAVQRALATVAALTGLSTTIQPENGALSLTAGPDAGPAEWVRLGADTHRLRAALAAEGISSTVHTRDDGVLVSLP